MRFINVLILTIICSSCSLKTFDIPKAPVMANQAVVFDIDGTLTPDVSSIFTAREDAATVVRLFADRGYKIVYLSARVRLLQSGIPGWLKENNFPEGSIQVPQSSTDSEDHAKFKKRILTEFKNNGWKFLAAYGDSSTDFQAYSEVGIAKDRIFALRRSGYESCQSGIWTECLSSWTEHINRLEQLMSF